MIKKLAFVSAIILLTLACKKEKNDEQPVVEEKELTQETAADVVADHTRNGEARSTYQGNEVTTDDGVVYTTEGSSRGNQVREIVTIDVTSITLRKRKNDKNNDIEVVWFAESEKEDGSYDNLVYWCYKDGTYDVENWLTGDSYWGYWYAAEDGSKLAFDLGSEFEETFEISSINNSTFSLKNEKSGDIWTFTGFDLGDNSFIEQKSSEEIENMIANTFWYLWLEESDDDEFVTDYEDDQNIYVERYTLDGSVDIYDTDTWYYDDLSWEYVPDLHAIKFGNNDFWYISYIDDYDIETFQWDEDSQSILFWAQEDLDYWYDVDGASDLGYEVQ